MAAKKTARRKSTGKKSVQLSKKRDFQMKMDPALALILKILGGCAVLIYMFLSVYTNVAGVLGVGFKWLLAALFGDGLYYVPFISVYILVISLLIMRNKDGMGKIIAAGALMLCVAAGSHLLSDAYVDSLSLKNLGELVKNAQNSLNGGIFGTYLGEGIRALLGDIGANIFIILANLFCLFVMFNEAIAFVVVKLAEWVKKTFCQEKTSKVFRVPGVKADPVRSDEVIQKERKKQILEVPIEMEEKLPADVIIEKFATNEDRGKAPEITAEATPQQEVRKQPALSVQELESVSQELNEAKEQEIKEYVYPPVEFLNEGVNRPTGLSKEELNQNAIKLVSTLREFGVEAEVVSVQEGPAVTRYEIRPQIGVKISKILGLSEDIALRMAAKGIRIAPVPGKSVMGVEIANQKVMPVFVRDVITSKEFQNHSSKIAFALGKDIAGTTVVGDIAKMPHCLIAGSTGSGKSVCINSLITSILYKASPEEVKMIMIDPKVVELSVYNGIPHLLIPVVTDPRKAAGALNWAMMEMTNRYHLFEKANVRDLESYNEHQIANGEQPLPKIVIIVDELADLMMASPKEVEEYICRLAQLARAAGMHLIIATQRPSVDVITGLIKANMPSRIAFAVSSQIDSRTILDMGGAEKLLGKGDMLYAPIGESKPIRVQGALVTDGEVEKIVSFLRETSQATYDDDIMSHVETSSTKDGPSPTSDAGDADQMLPECIEFVVELGEASVSKLQRRFKLGYSRAARIVDQMEERGIVGPSEGSKPRQVLITKEQYYEMKVNEGI
ncbi:MAG: DUF87 domain-containing protein [Clostridia bacterium]|nr:DUF87 domain-containing protein [Clostridia bacterium]